MYNFHTSWAKTRNAELVRTFLLCWDYNTRQTDRELQDDPRCEGKSGTGSLCTHLSIVLWHLSTHVIISFMAHKWHLTYSKCAGGWECFVVGWPCTHSGALGCSWILVKIYKSTRQMRRGKHIPQLEEWPSNHKLLTLLGSCWSRTWLQQPNDLFLQTAPTPKPSPLQQPALQVPRRESMMGSRQVPERNVRSQG